MNLNTLNQLRHDIYAGFEQAGDSLFNLADALLAESQAQSVIELSLSPCFERKWPSLYEALQRGKLNQAHFEQTMLRYAPQPQGDARVVLIVDACNIERPFSQTSPDRIMLYVHNLPDCEVPPVVAGWQFSTVVVAPQQASSQTFILSNRRIASSTKPLAVALQQLCDLRPYFTHEPLILADRAYPSCEFIVGLTQAEYAGLLRLKTNRVFWRAVPAQTEPRRRGAPKKHGTVFKCKDATTHGSPDAAWTGQDERGQTLEVSRWDGLHLRKAPGVSLSVIRVGRLGASGTKDDPVESWFVWVGHTPIELDMVWATYKRRFSIEHGYRFDKQDLLWTQPRLRYPAQFELWTSLVSFVHNELMLARELEVAQLRPWESRERVVSPQQVRRGLAGIIKSLDNPARPPKGRGKGRGRLKGAVIIPAPRCKVVKKGPKAHRNKPKTAKIRL